jgi:hypothetical protein
MGNGMQEDWRTSGSYSYLDGLSPLAIAWEFMRRNSEYQAHYRSMIGGTAAFIAQRWRCVVDPDLRADHAHVAWLLNAADSVVG